MNGAIARIRGIAYFPPVSLRRLLPLLAMLALLVAPFGRLAAAEAMALPHHGSAAAAAGGGHCSDMPAPDRDRPTTSIDCMIACAAMNSADAPSIAPAPVAVAAPEARPLPDFTGFNPAADPPPPRFS